MSDTTDDYLKHIYELAQEESPVKTSRLALALDVSAAATTEMVKRLEAQALVEHTKYKGVTLTREGHARAVRVLRRHRLWEVFLQRVLGVPWPELHGHACKLEHATDDRLADLLAGFLGEPEHDPHGNPIPARDGTVTTAEGSTLTSERPGARLVIVRCSDEAPELLAYLAALGLTPGTEIEFVELAPFHGPVTLRVGGELRAIGREAASRLLVRRAEGEGVG